MIGALHPTAGSPNRRRSLEGAVRGGAAEMMVKRTNRVAWGLVMVLAVTLLAGVGLLGVRLRPYWVAKYRGRGANLRYAVLVGASLERADLEGADLRGADLRCADLKDAYLGGADLRGADLRGANLDAAFCLFTSSDGAMRIETLARFGGALYDRKTRWPEPYVNDVGEETDEFAPHKLGAVLVK